MKESTNKKKGTLTIEDNYKIVSLIKAKINPIQKKVILYLCRVTYCCPGI